MNGNPDPETRDEQIAAYVDGAMTSDERAAFERALSEDPTLQVDVEMAQQALDAARDWIAAPPPGLERADRLEIPVPRRARRRVWWSLSAPIWRMAAATAIFAVGFLLGQGSNQTEGPGGSPAIQDVRPQTAEIAPAKIAPTPAVTPARDTKPVQVAMRAPRTTTVEENGRLRIETTLKDSGARAVWIVDGGFRLAKAD